MATRHIVGNHYPSTKPEGKKGGKLSALAEALKNFNGAKKVKVKIKIKMALPDQPKK